MRSMMRAEKEMIMSTKTEPTAAIARRGEGAMAPWSPWRELSEMRRQMDEFFSRMLGYTPLSHMIPGAEMRLEPPVDIFETDEMVMVYAACPGYTPEAIRVEATEDTVTIEGERKPLRPEKATLHREGWLASSENFSLTFSLPAEIDPDRVKAIFENGILRLEMPKVHPVHPRSVKVNVASG